MCTRALLKKVSFPAMATLAAATWMVVAPAQNGADEQFGRVHFPTSCK
jgi:hypothetical protein